MICLVVSTTLGAEVVAFPLRKVLISAWLPIFNKIHQYSPFLTEINFFLFNLIILYQFHVIVWQINVAYFILADLLPSSIFLHFYSV